jgi:hypothetical protein
MMLRITIRLAACILVVVSLAAAPRQTPQTWKIQDAPAELQPAVAKATLVITSMQDALLAELTDALAKGGPPLAINACHLEATAIAQRVARMEGVPAGRTSHRLRNPTNAPKPWAAPIVAEYAGRRASDVEGFVVDLGNKVGVIRPIAHRSMCASCHGPANRLGPEVRAALADRYPADRAVDFREGEIRGWYWVEIAKGS